MSRDRVQHRWLNIIGALAVLTFLLAVLFFDRPADSVSPAPAQATAPVQATAQAVVPWQCPMILERLVANHREQVELGFVADASPLLLQKYHRTLCETLRLRDEIAVNAAFSRIGEYLEQHNKLQAIQRTLGYWEGDIRQPGYSLEATGIWFNLLVMAQSMEPVPFHWVKCQLENPADGDQCWRSEVRVGEIKVSAELYGPFSSLRIEFPTYTFHRLCDGIRPETSYLLWSCAIDGVNYHPDGWSAECTPMFATWNRTGLLIFFQPEDGPFCSDGPPLPPVQVEPEWPDHEKSPAPTPLPPGWSHL